MSHSKPKYPGRKLRLAFVATLFLPHSVNAGNGDIWMGVSTSGNLGTVKLTQVGKANFTMEYPDLKCGVKLAPLEYSTIGAELSEGSFSERPWYGRCTSGDQVLIKFTKKGEGTWKINHLGSISAEGHFASAQTSDASVASSGGGANIADAFHANAAEAIKRFSSWGSIDLTVRSIGVASGEVQLSDIQVPNSIVEASKSLQTKPFSWDSFHNTAVMGNNVYAQQYQVVCVVPLESFAKMSVKEGSSIKMEGKLRQYSEKTIIFDCK